MTTAVETGSEVAQQSKRFINPDRSPLASAACCIRRTSLATLAVCGSCSISLSSTQLLHLFDQANKADGVQIFIGGESCPLDEFSLVTAPYQVNGRVIGTLRRHWSDADGLRPG